MRILHLNTAKTWRGGERQVFNLALGLRDRKVAQLVVGQPGSALEERCLEAGLDFRGVRMRAELDPFAVSGIRRAAREFGADVLHAHTSRAHGLGLLAKKGIPGVKLAISRRVDFHMQSNFLSRRKYLSPQIDVYIAISQNVKSILTDDGVPAEGIEVVYSAIDPERYKDIRSPEYLREEFNMQPDELALINVAALVDHKDQRTLLSAMGILKSQEQELPGYRLFINGAGELETPLKTQAVELGLGNKVIFTGFREDVLSFYELADIFVMSSKEEGLGTAVLDAMHFGLPVATTDGGGLPEMIIHDKGGLVSPARNPEALAASIRELLLEGKKRKAMGEFNRKKVGDFSVEALIEGTHNVYRKLLGES